MNTELQERAAAKELAERRAIRVRLLRDLERRLEAEYIEAADGTLYIEANRMDEVIADFVEAA